MDETDLMDEVVSRLVERNLPYCVIGGQGVNAYVEPLVSLDVDVVVAVGAVDALLTSLSPRVRVEHFPHSINLSADGSDLRIQLQLDPRYADFPSRATEQVVLGRRLRVATVEDVLAGKIWAASDPSRRASKRQKDLADIARLVERFPELRPKLPPEIVERLL